MRDLLKLSEEELAELTKQQSLRMAAAIGFAIASGTLVLLAMMTRLSPGGSLLPGMDHPAGQVAWSTVLIAMMVIAGLLSRGVIAKRLQWAIAISLLIHLMLCFSLQTLRLAVPLNTIVQADELPGRPLEERSLPDYAGMDQPNAEAEWQKPAETPSLERSMDVERPKNEAVDPSQPKPVENNRPQEIVKAEPTAREQEVALQKEARAELERQTRESEMKSPQAVAEPAVTEAKSTSAESEARVEQARKANELAAAEREALEAASDDPSLKTARLNAQRSDPKPQAANVQVQMTDRTAAAAQAAASAALAETVNVKTGAASQVTAQEQAVELSRQQAAGLPQERSRNDSPASNPKTSISSAKTDPSAAVGNPANAAPSSGGAASIARSSTQAGSAAAANAQAVEVAASAAGGGASVQATQASSAAAMTRGSAATVPIGSAPTGNNTAPNAAQTGTAIRGTGNIARQSTGTGQPQLGQSAAIPSSTGSGTGRAANAVGTQAGEVAVAKAGTGKAAAGQGVMANGPGGTAVGRQSTALPSGTSGVGTGPTGKGATGTGTGSSGASGPVAVRSSGGEGLATRTEPTARLGTDAGSGAGTLTGLSTVRTGADAQIPSSATEAEQAGTLVFTGPQSQPAGSGRLTGPQVGTVPRRSAGLPGSAGSPGGGTGPIGNVASSSNTTDPSRLVSNPGRAGVSDDRPKLASAEQIAGLFKQTIPGIGISPEAKIGASFAMRKTESRREAARTLGGSESSEEAVERGLVWLASHQHPDGHWSIHELHCKDHECSGHGSFKSNSAATGLALLAFLGAGYTHQSGKYQAVVDRGLKWLLSHQKPDGDLFSDESEFVWFYSHGMASIAVSEAYGLTKDAALRDPAQKSLDFIIKSQHPGFGGWRYRPRFESDTSVSGWQLMALKSGEMAGLTVPKSAYDGVARWLDSVEGKSTPGQFSYHPSKPASLAMTAEGLLMRQYLGAGRNDTRLVSGADHLRRFPPELSERDSYYWYYATQVMFHMQGEYWDEWNARLRDTLVNTQLKDGGPNGSWSPDRPTTEKWGAAGGRHYITCLNLLMLEVYYRHLPLYIELAR